MTDKVSEFTPPKPPVGGRPETYKAAIVPLELWQEISDKLRNGVHRDVDSTLRQMTRCGVADVPVNQQPTPPPAA